MKGCVQILGCLKLLGLVKGSILVEQTPLDSFGKKMCGIRFCARRFGTHDFVHYLPGKNQRCDWLKLKANQLLNHRVQFCCERTRKKMFLNVGNVVRE